MITMSAARIHSYGDPEVLVVEDLPTPACGPDDVLVEVHASWVNPIDCKIRAGAQKGAVRRSLPARLGMDVSGVVIEVGSRVTGCSVGDEVWSSPHHKRQGTYAELYAKVVETSEIVAGLYGAAAVRALKLDGTTPRDGALLLRHAETAIALLRTHDLGKSRVKGATLSGKATAGELEALAQAVKTNLDDVAREAREAEGTLVKKRAAMATFDDVFSRSATLISALLALGGEKELAARVRPSTRRPGQAEGELGEPDAASAEPTE